MASFFKKLGLEVNFTDAESLSLSIRAIGMMEDPEDKLNVVNRKILTNL